MYFDGQLLFDRVQLFTCIFLFKTPQILFLLENYYRRKNVHHRICCNRRHFARMLFCFIFLIFFFCVAISRRTRLAQNKIGTRQRPNDVSRDEKSKLSKMDDHRNDNNTFSQLHRILLVKMCRHFANVVLIMIMPDIWWAHPSQWILNYDKI